jgi:uncharacterized membrane protein
MTVMSESPVVFEAVIVPHRSLGPRGLRWLALSLAGLSALVAFGLWLAGAWPVIGFTGGEVALAVWLLRRNALGARAMELLLLSDRGLAVIRVDPAGRRSERLLPSNWLRADLETRPGRTPALILRASGLALEVAASLGEDEKRSLAAELQNALHRQRHPTFDNAQLRPLSPPSAPST